MTPEITRSISFLDQLRGTIEKLERERDEAQAKLRESEAKCAEMRHVVDMWSETGCDEESQQYVDHALSSDCGKGYVRVEELETTIALLHDYIRYCTEWRTLRVADPLRAELARLEKLKETQ